MVQTLEHSQLGFSQPPPVKPDKPKKHECDPRREGITCHLLLNSSPPAAAAYTSTNRINSSVDQGDSRSLQWEYS
jgi:hypothetical protein